MKHYDILFIGQILTGKIFPFQGSPSTERCSPVALAAIAASCLGKEIATVTKISKSEEYLLESMKSAGIDLFLQPGEVGEMSIVFPTANVDERQLFITKDLAVLSIDDIPPLAPCLVHFCCFGNCILQLNLMRALKARGFRLSIDIQSFVFQVDDQTGAIHLQDVPDKEEILNIADFIKLDAVEAQILTGTGILQDQAEILEKWGSSETIITSSDGVLARSKGKSAFARFTNTNTLGRMGRGDTFTGSYIARRLDHSVEDSLRFAAALTSIKLESAGPFKNSLQEVIERMDKYSS